MFTTDSKWKINTITKVNFKVLFKITHHIKIIIQTRINITSKIILFKRIIKTTQPSSKILFLYRNYNNYHNNPKKSYKNEYADSYDYDTQTKSNHLYNKFSGDNYNNKKNYNTENINYNNSCKDWLYRYSRNGYIRNEIIQEDEDLFKDHIEAMTKKKCFFI